MKTTQERFEQKFMPEPNSGCWLWTAACFTNGYGAFWFDGNQVQAHRMAWILEHGSISGGMHVCHKCDVRDCVNPDHLFLGTNADNTADKMAKGREARGETQGLAKLTEEQVKAIRRSGVSHCAIARDYGIHESNVRQIRSYRTWKHVA